MFQDELKKLIRIIGGKPCIKGLFVGLGVGFIVGITVGVMIYGSEEVDENVSQVVEIPEKKVEIIDENLSVEEESLACVDISGAINAPGVYCLEKGSLLNHYLLQADGVDQDSYAKRYFEQRINAAMILGDGSKVYIPYKGDAVCEFSEVEDPLFIGGKDLVDEEGVLGVKDEIDVEVAEEEGEVTDVDVPDGLDCLDINTATLDELDALEGIGPSTAQKIIDARPYQGIDELLNVSGIGETKYEAIDEFICAL
jgi:competence protein ComEA